MSNGITPASASNTLMFVALYAPVIDRRHFFCETDIFAAEQVLLSRISLGDCHTEAPYVIAVRTTAVYTCRALLKIAPHVEAATLISAIDCEAIFDWISLVWGSHLSFPSIHKPSIFKSASGEI